MTRFTQDQIDQALVEFFRTEVQQRFVEGVGVTIYTAPQAAEPELAGALGKALEGAVDEQGAEGTV